MNINFYILSLIGFFTSFIISIIIIKYINIDTFDKFSGPQKIHESSIPRIGGLAIFGSLLLQSLMLLKNHNELMIIILCSFPVFFSGILEDFTNKVSARIRLTSSFISALLLVLIFEVNIETFEIPFLEFLFQYSFVIYFITILSIISLIQAINLIDGLNGLAKFSSLIMLVSIMILSYEFGDKLLILLCLSLIMAILGLIFFNFPYGRIFLGDGGAYLLGSCIALLVIMLSMRNDEISPFASLLIVLYPIYELIRTVLRRSIKDYKMLIYPDSNHLHSNVYKYMSTKLKLEPISVNSISSICCLLFPLATCTLAVLFYNNLPLLLLIILIYILSIESLMKFLNCITNE